ncbi:amylo-alpha-1,6-glucosidase [Nordella sp. HKS 07]|uniref:amylo-alpha-1,6-glucosidase n=1 Tax=Nordella sp. HKS 07 TaxID=2712222 RepID=UPI0013E1BF28|nr:amylo-alpha-1,6-glucosidase [Nordella sp. HKS 07]QIG51065.1 amylo-alpha-1,6-glucosidase [Nordella sp. HKS 07]
MLQDRKYPRAGGDEQFQVSAFFSLQERRPRILKRDDTFAVIDPNGDLLSGFGSSDGIYYRDTRYLSHYELLIGGVRPILLSSSLTDDSSMLVSDLANPDIFAEQKLVLRHDSIHIRRSKFLQDGVCHERVVVRNFADVVIALPIEFRFQADFADIFEVRGLERPRRGAFLDPVLDGGSVVLSYNGLDGRRLTTTLILDPVPDTLEGNHAIFILPCAPREHRIIFVTMSCVGIPPPPPRENYLRSLVAIRRQNRAERPRSATIDSSNEIFNEAIRRAQCDIEMLTSHTPHGPYVYAGIPWFSTVFGRDALITALLTLWSNPVLARGVLSYLAAHQAVDENPLSDAEPGKILHEIRNGEMALLGEVPFRRYYGSVDSTLLFVILAGAYCEATADMDFTRQIWTNVERAMSWAATYGDIDGDGFIEYRRKSEGGLVNQGWKDSHDSIFHRDGAIAEPPIALCEVQAYYYGALLAAAAMAGRLGHAEAAATHRQKATGLRRNFNEAFWCEELDTFALALDGKKRRCAVRSSNAGHALLTGLADFELARRTARTLMDASSMSGWGIRTIATTELRYNPMSYHNGSVWPHDNALIALGFARYGYKSQVVRIFEGLFSAASYIDLRRLPELFCGFPRRPARGPTFYPVACSPQAWAAASLLSLVQSSLGLDIDPETREIRLERPILPQFLDEITLCRVQAGGGLLDLTLRRAGQEVAANAVHRAGGARLVLKS